MILKIKERLEAFFIYLLPVLHGSTAASNSVLSHLRLWMVVGGPADKPRLLGWVSADSW